MERFSLEPRIWYASQLIGDEFNDETLSRSPIRVYELAPNRSGERTFRLSFYHANYPEGVRDKSYNLQTIERGRSFILARSLDHHPPRLLLIFNITSQWISRYFPELNPNSDNIQSWMDNNI